MSWNRVSVFSLIQNFSTSKSHSDIEAEEKLSSRESLSIYPQRAREISVRRPIGTPFPIAIECIKSRELPRANYPERTTHARTRMHTRTVHLDQRSLPDTWRSLCDVWWSSGVWRALWCDARLMILLALKVAQSSPRMQASRTRTVATVGTIRGSGNKLNREFQKFNF